MRKLRKILFTLFILITFSTIDSVFAATNNVLISIGSGSDKLEVRESTTISEIETKLGEAKLVTDSAFGGKAYTFYTDNNYSNFLYVETSQTGAIVSYGSVDPTFKADKGSYGDDYGQYSLQRNRMGGVFYPSKDNKVIAGLFYNVRALALDTNNHEAETANFFVNTYKSNPTKYLKGISEQAVLMFNALAKKLGKEANLKFDENIFYVNEQMKEFGSSIRTYAEEMDKDSYVYRIKASDNVEIDSRYYVLNPLQFAQYAGEPLTDYKEFNDKNKNIGVFDYDIDKKKLTVITVKENIFERLEKVTLTDEETSKLSAGRYEYQQAITNLNKESGLYKVNPITTPASELLAGELKDSKKQGITDFVNAVRVAAGLGKLKVDKDAFDVAQHIAVLSTYRWVDLGQEIQHKPSQPEGVTLEFYHTAVAWERAMAENIGRIVSQSDMSKVDGNDMIYHIKNFLDDSTEVGGIFFSHRDKVLGPTVTKFGYGVSPYIYTNEFAGVEDSDVEFVGWPSKGITFMESLKDENFYWTAKFYSNYKITDQTTVEVENLRNGQKWTFEEEENTGKNDSKYSRWFQRDTGDSENRVVFHDRTIEPVAGEVYQITLHNVQKESTGENTDYVYRSVFENGDANKYATGIDKIIIKTTDTFVKVPDEDVYYVPINEEAKLDAVINSGVTDKKVTWMSSNPYVSVTQNGIVYARALTSEDVVITVSYDGSNVTDQIVIRPYRKLEQVKLNENDVNCLALGKDTDISQVEPSKKISIIYVPDDATEVTQITWKVISNATPDIEYDIDNPEITKYIKVVVDEENPKNIDIYALDAQMNNNIYTVLAKVKGLVKEYTGSCKVTVRVPIEKIEIVTKSRNIELDKLSRKMTIDYDLLTDKFFNLSTIVLPENATDPRDVTWHVDDANIITDYNTQGTFSIEKEGSTKIKATLNSNDEITDTIDVTVNATLRSLSLSGIATQKITSSEKKTDQLTLTRDPEVDNDEIEYDTSSDSVATVDGNGLVTFVGPGRARITAKSKELPSISAVFEYTVKMLVDSLEFKDKTKDLEINRVYQIPVTYSPLNASDTTNIRYETEDTDIIQIDNTGKVLTLAIGQAKVKAYIGSNYTSTQKRIEAEYTINVKAPLRSVSLPSALTMVKSTEREFKITTEPEITTDEYEVEWSSLEEDTVSIDSKTGLATAHKTGETDIIANVTNKTTGASYQATTTVTVVDYIKGDMDRNGTVNAVDAAIVLDRFVNKDATELDIAIGDMDGKGDLNATDASMIVDLFTKGK